MRFAVVWLVACYAPNVPAGAPCSASAPCPVGQQCIAGTCDGHAPADARTYDGRLDLGDARHSDARTGCVPTGLTCNGGITVSSCNGTCFVGCTEAVPQSVAEQRCIAWGGHLASILTQADANCAPQGWIGFVQANGATKPNEGWSWIAGDPVAFTDWAVGQPDDGGHDVEHGIEQCADINASGTWNDDACTIAMGFACR